MRTVVVRERLSNHLMRGLLALAAAAMLCGASPATDDALTGRALGGEPSSPMMSEPGLYQWQPSDSATLTSRSAGLGAPRRGMASEPGLYQWRPSESAVILHVIDYGEAEVAWRHALREAETALRVVRAFGNDLVTPEVDSYFREVEAVLGAMPAKPEPRHARAFAVSLQQAREKFITEASSYGVWTKLSRAVDPTADRRRVPERFVKRLPVEEATALGLTKADIRVQRAVRDFLALDAHPRSFRA